MRICKQLLLCCNQKPFLSRRLSKWRYPEWRNPHGDSRAHRWLFSESGVLANGGATILALATPATIAVSCFWALRHGDCIGLIHSTVPCRMLGEHSRLIVESPTHTTAILTATSGKTSRTSEIPEHSETSISDGVRIGHSDGFAREGFASRRRSPNSGRWTVSQAWPVVGSTRGDVHANPTLSSPLRQPAKPVAQPRCWPPWFFASQPTLETLTTSGSVPRSSRLSVAHRRFGQDGVVETRESSPIARAGSRVPGVTLSQGSQTRPCWMPVSA